MGNHCLRHSCSRVRPSRRLPSSSKTSLQPSITRFLHPKNKARFKLLAAAWKRRQIICDVRTCWLAYSCLRLSGASCLHFQTGYSRVVSSMPWTCSLQMDHFSIHRSFFATKLPGHMLRHGTNQSCQLVIIFSHPIHAENPSESHCTQFIYTYIYALKYDRDEDQTIRSHRRYLRYPRERWKKVH